MRLSTRLAGFSVLVAAATVAAIIVLVITADPGEHRDRVILPVLTVGCVLSGVGFGLAAVQEYRELTLDSRSRLRPRILLVIGYAMLAVGLFLYTVVLHMA